MHPLLFLHVQFQNSCKKRQKCKKRNTHFISPFLHFHPQNSCKKVNKIFKFEKKVGGAPRKIKFSRKNDSFPWNFHIQPAQLSIFYNQRCIENSFQRSWRHFQSSHTGFAALSSGVYIICRIMKYMQKNIHEIYGAFPIIVAIFSKKNFV